MNSRRIFLASSLGALTHRAQAQPASTSPRSADIDRTLRSGIVTHVVPSAVGMVANAKETLYRGAFGVRDNSGVPAKVDSIFSIASMTKAITTVAALQLVEAGKLSLDSPVGKFLPRLANPKVLEKFDAKGKPVVGAAKTPVTLKHLLTHTSGLCYSSWDETAFHFMKDNKDPNAGDTLMFEPGTRWQYGTGLDFAGNLVESLWGMSLEDYFQQHILKPLEMTDTSYILPAAKFDRLTSNWSREPNGKLKQAPRALPKPPKQFSGGGGLYSTAADYTRFMQMILGRGRGVNGATILKPETVAGMEVNQIGSASAGKMKSFDRTFSEDVDIQPGHTEKWGLGFLINTDPYEGGRSAGSLAWAGLFNTFYWIDLKRSLCAVLLMQLLPFVDHGATGLLGDFERAVYRGRAA